MMVYGVVDLINAIKIHQCRRSFEKAHQAQAAANEVEPQAIEVIEENEKGL